MRFHGSICQTDSSHVHPVLPTQDSDFLVMMISNLILSQHTINLEEQQSIF
jgi:hypothetical protein